MRDVEEVTPSFALQCVCAHSIVAAAPLPLTVPVRLLLGAIGLQFNFKNGFSFMGPLV